jgi:hypothetical protein
MAYRNATPRRLRSRKSAAGSKEKCGGLYLGMHDCCRSVMCERDGGGDERDGMCHACHALLTSKAFQKRVARREGSAGAEPDASTNTSRLTPEERATKLDVRAAGAKAERRKGDRQRLAADAKLAEAEERAAAAASDAQQLLHECLRLADGASAAERSAAEAKVALAIEAQQHATEWEAAASQGRRGRGLAAEPRPLPRARGGDARGGAVCACARRRCSSRGARGRQARGGRDGARLVRGGTARGG